VLTLPKDNKSAEGQEKSREIDFEGESSVEIP
jgi:hypothetical protein